jgi:hypothetical protein
VATDQCKDCVINIGSFNSVEILEVANLIRDHFVKADIILYPTKLENTFTFNYSSKFLCSIYSDYLPTPVEVGLEKVYLSSTLHC